MAEVWREKFSGGRSGDAQQAETKTSDKQEVKTADKLTLFNNAALKVGKIISVRRHPNAERLYIEQIDCGESAPRQVISGIVQHFSEAELLNRHVLVVTGLKPAVIRKENSAGMLLTFEAGEKLELPDLSAHAPGTPVIIKEPAENTPAKREQVSVDEFYSLGLKLTDGTVTLDGNPLTVGDKPLTAPTFKEGQEQARDLFEEKIDGNIYSRFSNPTVTELKDKLCLMEKTEDGIITSTADSWAAEIKPNTKMFFMETPSNPGLEIGDLARAAELCRKHGLIFNVDNCFATPYLQNPAEWGADIITHSATKFIDGQGRVLGGAVLGKAELIKEVRFPVAAYGTVNFAV
ncbi:hypothetical protein CHS0354_006852 [Potamilus streckersoni]|uniref:tRNA-binding domain-containing protein n=1 Tax=Potamilus streckersoni TaxID=2493646 RepID=A0AAE0TEC6_9BIVA|nr:hypothetical protein CHS0354_006852 [Potamilus streckersoni]